MYNYDLVCTNGKWYGIISREGKRKYETRGYETRDEAKEITQRLTDANNCYV